METTVFYVSSVTNAMRGRNILQYNGMTAKIDRAPTTEENSGCGYRLTVRGDRETARRLLGEAGIRIRRTVNGGDRR